MFNKKQRFIISLSHGKLTFSTLSSLSDFSPEVNDTTTTATYRRLWMQHHHVTNSSSGTCNINRLGIHYNRTQNYDIIINSTVIFLAFQLRVGVWKGQVNCQSLFLYSLLLCLCGSEDPASTLLRQMNCCKTASWLWKKTFVIRKSC